MTNNETKVLAALRKEAESDDGNGFWTVYLDNARLSGLIPSDCLSPKSFAAVLGSLNKKGLYRDIDGYAWGQVLMA